MRKVERSATKKSNQKSPFDDKDLAHLKSQISLEANFANFQKSKSLVVFSFMNFPFYSLRLELKSTCLIKAAVAEGCSSKTNNYLKG